MKAFGIELRKADSQSIFNDVDMVLAETSLQQLQVDSVKHALQKMFKANSFFDICTVDACIKVCQIHIPRERYDCYHAVHCVHWNEMTPDFRTRLTAYLLDDFRSILQST